MTDDRPASDLHLSPPSIALRAQFLDMAADYRAAGEDRYDQIVKQFAGDFEAYLALLDEQSRGVNLPPEHVPQNTFWLVRDDQRILGVSRLRHRLNDRLLEWGCNIGYGIRPAQRRKGYGTKLLSLTLEEARQIGLDRVLLTCDATNIGSIGVIRCNNGRLDSEYFLERVGGVVRRYAIDL